jgi:short-subunit dehydrogenase
MIGSKEKYALVTGASSGIGYELAKLFAQDGKNIVVVARSQDRLEKLKTEIENKSGTKVIVLVKDLSKSDAPQEIFSELEKKSINIDVLVNNAGFPVHGMFAETNLKEELDMIQVNITALTHFTKLFMKKMVENKSGWILNVGSTGSFAPFPTFSVYAATKAYVLSFSEAIANELQGTGVSVTCLCPGVTDTRFYERGNAGEAKFAKTMKKMDATRVASIGYTALKKGRVTVVTGLVWSIGMFAFRLLPRKLVTRALRSQAKHKSMSYGSEHS